MTSIIFLTVAAPLAWLARRLCASIDRRLA